jgi:hypothetical protein
MRGAGVVMAEDSLIAVGEVELRPRYFNIQEVGTDCQVTKGRKERLLLYLVRHSHISDREHFEIT